MHTLQTLWTTFFKLCCLRLKPQDLPASSVFLSLTLLFYAITSSALSLEQLSVTATILSGLVETSLLVVLTVSLLYFTHYPARIIQTLTALAGTNILLGILSILPTLWLHQAKINHNDIGIPLLLLLGLMIWSWVIYAHILRHALAVSFFTGFVITIVIFLFIISVLEQLFPSSG
jgi:hypothetical protein